MERVIRVVIDSRQAEASTTRIERGLRGVGDQSDRTNRRINRGFGNVSREASGLRRTLGGIFALAGVGLAVRELVQLADAYTQIQNRLRVVTSGTQELESVTQELFDISQRTRSSFESTVELYSRVSLASKNLGISQQETAQFTESLNQAVILSGASAQEASAGLIQLSQGLASGALRGDELGSVLEQLPVVADVIAESLGRDRGELRELGKQGKISAQQVIAAFAGAREELADRFGKTIPTIAQSFEQLRGTIINLSGQFNQAVGTSSGFVSVISSLNEFLKESTPSIVNLGRALTGTLRPTDELSVNLRVLARILIGIGGAFSIFVDSVITPVVFAFRSVGRVIGNVAAQIALILKGDFTGALNVARQGLKDFGDDVFTTFGGLREDIVGTIDESIEKINQLSNAELRSPAVEQEEIIANTGTQLKSKEQSDLASATEERNRVLQEQLGLLFEEQEILQAVGLEREILLASLQIEETLRSTLGDKVENLTQEQINSLSLLSEAELELFGAQIKVNEQLKQRSDVLGELKGPQEDINQRIATLNALLKSNPELAGQINAELEKLIFTQARLNFELGNASFEDGFLLALQNTIDAAENWQGEIGSIFGDVFTDIGEGFADATANAILFGESFEEAFGNAARNALQQIVSGLIRLGVQFLINQTIGQSAITSASATQVAANQAITQSATPAAAATSLASFGANAAPAIAGILAVAAIANSLGGFQTGADFRVGGSGGNDSQLVMFRANPEETVSIRTPQQRDREENRLTSTSNEESGSSQAGTNVINVLDPALLQDMVATQDGVRTLVNVIGRNKAAFNSALT